MSAQVSPTTTFQPLKWVGWRTIQVLAALNIPYLVLVLCPYLVYRIPWRTTFLNPKDYWPYGSEGLGAIVFFLAGLASKWAPILLPLMAVIAALVVRPFWQQQEKRAKLIIILCIAITGLVGVSPWFWWYLDTTNWLDD